MINIIRGIKTRFNQESGFVERKYNGNTIIEFVHPNEREQEILVRAVHLIAGLMDKREK